MTDNKLLEILSLKLISKSARIKDLERKNRALIIELQVVKGKLLLNKKS